MCECNDRRAGRGFRDGRFDVLRSSPKIRQAGEPKRLAAPIQLLDLVIENRNALTLKGAANLLAVVPPIMVSQHAVNSERRFQVFEIRGGYLGLGMLRISSATSVVITQQND